MTAMFNPPHPGELLDDYLDGMSIAEAARRLGVTRATLSRIRNGHAAVTADMALRFADLFGSSAEHWLTMQTAYDLWAARSRRPAVLARGAATSQPSARDARATRPEHTGIELASWLDSQPVASHRTSAELDEQIAHERAAWEGQAVDAAAREFPTFGYGAGAPAITLESVNEARKAD